MRLLRDMDVIKAVDRHTRDDGTLDADISVILEEVKTAYDKKLMIMKRVNRLKISPLIKKEQSIGRKSGNLILR